MESSGILKEFIIRQTEIDKFVFEVVLEKDLNNNDVKLIKNTMDTYLGPGLKLEIRRVHKINRPKSGKIKHFHSEINT